MTCVAPVPGTRRALSSGYDGAVGLFDFDTGEARLLGYHQHLANRIVVDPARPRAASLSADYTVFLWDLRDNRLERVFRGHSDDVEDFVFIDDETAASVGLDRRILVWDLRTGAIVRELEGHERELSAVAYLDGRLYTCGDDRTLRSWDLASGRTVRMWGPFDMETDSCAIDPVRRRVVMGCDDGVVRAFGLDDESVIAVEAHTSGIKKVATCPVSGDILSAAYDQRVAIWGAGDLRLKVELEKRPSTWERSLNWSADGARVVAGTFDGTAVEWDARSGRVRVEAGEPGDGNPCFNEVAATATGDLALVSDDGYVRLARLGPDKGDWCARIAPRSGRVLMNAVAFDPEFRLVVSGAHDHKAHIFTWAGDALRDEVDVLLDNGPVNTIRIARHRGFEAQSFIGCYGGSIFRVSPRGEVAATLHVHEAPVKSLRLHPREPVGVSCSADGSLATWDLGGRVLDRFIGHLAVADDVDFSPSGTAFASTGRDFTLQVYGLSDGRRRHLFPLGRRSPKSLCFVTETLVLVGNYWGELFIADLIAGTVRHRTIARNGISSLARCGSNVVATSYDGGVYLVRPADGAVLQTLRAMTQRLDAEVDHA